MASSGQFTSVDDRCKGLESGDFDHEQCVAFLTDLWVDASDGQLWFESADPLTAEQDSSDAEQQVDPAQGTTVPIPSGSASDAQSATGTDLLLDYAMETPATSDVPIPSGSASDAESATDADLLLDYAMEEPAADAQLSKGHQFVQACDQGLVAVDQEDIDEMTRKFFGGDTSKGTVNPPPLALQSVNPPPLALQGVNPPPLALQAVNPPPLALHNVNPPPLALQNVNPLPLAPQKRKRQEADQYLPAAKKLQKIAPKPEAGPPVPPVNVVLNQAPRQALKVQNADFKGWCPVGCGKEIDGRVHYGVKCCNSCRVSRKSPLLWFIKLVRINQHRV